MAKLYPPYIEGTLPARTGTTMTVPLTLNRATAANAVKSAVAKIKTVQGTTLIGALEGTLNLTCTEAYFTLPADTLSIGRYYKVQIALIDASGDTGYFSTIGVMKYTSEPTVTIENLKPIVINNTQYSYNCKYTNTDDVTEKLYSSYIKIVDADDNIYYQSDEKLHNVSEDTVEDSVEIATESFTVSEEMPSDKTLYIRYYVHTTNDLIRTSQRYKIVEKEGVDPDLKGTLTATLNYDEGYINVTLVAEKQASGTFLIQRKNVKENSWEQFGKFLLVREKPNRVLLRDFTIEQGQTYIYAIQQYNDNGLYSKRITSNNIYADFEDAFLFDGTRQLKIRFNPKVSSFKQTILESKQDTIGSKYPFIFRNGVVNYHQFPISGLISALSDPEQLFKTNEETILTRKSTPTDVDKSLYTATQTDLVSKNIANEREFKLSVLEWLNDANPKLFKSPVEGNYLVRLMDTSLTPTDTLGRMLHTFSSTAYEIAAADYSNLVSYNIIDADSIDNVITKWRTIDLSSVETGTNIIDGTEVHSITLSELIPGTAFTIDGSTIVVGATGSYHVTNEEGFDSLVLVSSTNQGTALVAVSETQAAEFALYSDVETIDYPIKQYIGSPSYWSYQDIDSDNLLDYVGNNIKETLKKITSVKFSNRDIIPIFTDGINYFTDMNGTTLMTEFEALDLYQICNVRDSSWDLHIKNQGYYIYRQYEDGYYTDAEGEQHAVATGQYASLNESGVLEIIDGLDTTCSVNGDEFIVDDQSFDVELTDYGDITSITFGNAIICEVGCQIENKIYTYETSDSNIARLKAAAEAATTYSEWKTAYRAFIERLTEKIQEYKKLMKEE